MLPFGFLKVRPIILLFLFAGVFFCEIEFKWLIFSGKQQSSHVLGGFFEFIF